MFNEKFNNVLEGKAQQVPPIWFMRQAGRYHSHYRALREKHSFVDLCKRPELAAEVALGPIEEFDFDIAILFSDLLFPLEALGMGLEYNPGPQLDRKLNEKNINELKPVSEAIAHMNFQYESVKATRELLPNNKSLIGFVGAPWTLFTYAVEGSHKGGLQEAKSKMSLFFPFEKIITNFLEQNIKIQLDAGAEQVVVMDTAAGELSENMYLTIIAPAIKKLASQFPKKLAYYSKYTHKGYFQDYFLDKNLSGIGFDHRLNLVDCLSEKRSIFVQGNFDNNLLFCDRDTLKKYLSIEIEKVKSLSLEQRNKWIFGLGHGVLPKTPEDNIKFVVDYVRESLNG